MDPGTMDISQCLCTTDTTILNQQSNGRGEERGETATRQWEWHCIVKTIYFVIQNPSLH